MPLSSSLALDRRASWPHGPPRAAIYASTTLDRPDRLNAFGLPLINGDTITFPERLSDQAATGRVTLKKADGSIVSVE